MKVKAFVLCVFFLTATACAPSYFVADPSPALENSNVTLNLDHDIGVTRFDGEEVEWNAWGFGIFPLFTEASVTIPPGKHTFLLDYQGYSGGSYGTAENISFQYDFKAGKIYKLKPLIDGYRIEIGIEEE